MATRSRETDLLKNFSAVEKSLTPATIVNLSAIFAFSLGNSDSQP
jgi:hypothetical protein